MLSDVRPRSFQRVEKVQGKSTSIVEERLKTRRIMLVAIVPHYITVVYRGQNVGLEVEG